MVTSEAIREPISRALITRFEKLLAFTKRPSAQKMYWTERTWRHVPVESTWSTWSPLSRRATANCCRVLAGSDGPGDREKINQPGAD